MNLPSSEPAGRKSRHRSPAGAVPLAGIVSTLFLLGAPGSILAQDRRATTVAGASRATPIAATRTPVPAGPEGLNVAQRVELARVAGLSVSGITSELRLTAAAPYAKDGRLETKLALVVLPYEGGGSILFQPDMSNGPSGGEATTKFRLASAGRPVLVDFIVSVSSKPGPMGVYLSGSGVNESRALAQGSHHVTALLVPAEAGWYELSLRLDPTKDYKRLTLLAVEITVLK